MEFIEIDINKIKINEEFKIFKNLEKEDIKKLKKRFPFVIDLVINKNNELIFDYDFLKYHKENNNKLVKVLICEFDFSESIFLAYNFRDKFFSISDYEKLLFLKKIIDKVDVKDIYKRIDLGIKINKDLILNINKIINSYCKEGLSDGFITLDSCKRIIDFNEQDKKELINLFKLIKFSYSNQLKLIEYLEEISFKEKVSFGKILDRINLDEVLNSNNPEKDFMLKITKLRFPLYMKTENEWEKELKSLKLPNNFKVNHFHFFEKKSINLSINFNNKDEFIEFINKVKK